MVLPIIGELEARLLKCNWRSELDNNAGADDWSSVSWHLRSIGGI